MSAPDWRKGRLLVAAPNLLDPHFHRAVVLMLEHSEEGALGLILNRPSGLAMREALPDELRPAAPEQDVVHEGGPVEPEGVILLAEFIDPADVTDLAVGAIGVVDPASDLATLPERARAMRAFAGHAGWAPGQLEAEIAEEAWIDAVCVDGDVFTDEPDELWSSVLERKGGSYRLVARMPLDPTQN